jgi:hypothetical protein
MCILLRENHLNADNLFCPQSIKIWSFEFSIVIYIFHEFFASFLLLMLFVIVPVQYVMLEHKDYVEDYRHDSKHPLHDVESTATEGRLAMAHCLYDILHYGEGAAREIKHDIRDGPAHSRFTLVVQVDLKVLVNAI